jgi:hypothetical protein
MITAAPPTTSERSYRKSGKEERETMSWENEFISRPENAVSPSMHKAGEEARLDLLIKQIDEAGIDLVVAPGRTTSPGSMQIKAVGDEGAIDYNVSDETLVSLRKRWNRWMRHWSYRARRLAPRVRPGQGKSPSALGESREHHAALPR